MASYFTSSQKATQPGPKMHVSTGCLPPYVNPDQAPTKKSPWRQIHSLPLLKSVHLILPDDLYNLIWPRLNPTSTQSRYAKLFLKLEDILTGEFFTHFIKTPGSNVALLSEGIPGVDNLFSLHEGKLRLDLAKEDYQRAGLQGQPVKNSGARKHAKERFMVEIDLRAVSMVKGKKGYDRLLYACKNVLDRSLLWIFLDLSPGREEGNEHETSLNALHPTWVDMEPQSTTLDNVLVPEMISNTDREPLSAPPAVETLDDYYDVVEWLDLATLDSPRIRRGDRPDPYISRYTVPGHEDSIEDPSPAMNLKVLSWTGALDSNWLIHLLVDLMTQTRKTKSAQWLALTATAHSTEAVGQINGYSILMQPDLTAQDDEGIDVAMTDTPVDGDVNNNMAEPSNAELHQRSGLQRFTCFQFVDS